MDFFLVIGRVSGTIALLGIFERENQATEAFNVMGLLPGLDQCIVGCSLTSGVKEVRGVTNINETVRRLLFNGWHRYIENKMHNIPLGLMDAGRSIMAAIKQEVNRPRTIYPEKMAGRSNQGSDA